MYIYQTIISLQQSSDSKRSSITLHVTTTGLRKVVAAAEAVADTSSSSTTSTTTTTALLTDPRHLERIRSIQAKLNLTSCRHTANGNMSFSDACPEGFAIQYYNPLDHDRYLCGNTIKAQGFLLLESNCAEPSRLFPVIPDFNGTGMPPVSLSFNAPSFDKDDGPLFPCDVPCTSTGGPGTLSQRFVKGTNWTIIFSMEGPEYYPSLNIQPDVWKKGTFYSTTSYDSDVPLPYYSKAEYTIQNPGLDYDKAIPGAVFLARNCGSHNHRERLVQDLMASEFRVDSLSSCLNNAKPPDGISLGDKLQVMRHYLFYLAFENQNVNDYITEKLWGPLQAGTVPIYYGAPNVHDHAPNHSLIRVQDYASTKDLVAYLREVASNKTLYESYHAWRTQPLPPHFRRRYDFTRVHSTCRTCQWAYARLYGIGWNHSRQTLQELASGSRNVCVDASGRVQRPFQEEWLISSEQNRPISHSKTTGGVTCDPIPLTGQSLTISAIRRTVLEQDGVIDLRVDLQEILRDNITLRLTTPLQDSATTFQWMDAHQGRLQNANSRYTFLTSSSSSQQMQMNMTATGVVELRIRAPLRIRIIVEDIDRVHAGADLETNYFANRMTQDFYNPVEGFIVQ
jgi:hypothetical protein